VKVYQPNDTFMATLSLAKKVGKREVAVGAGMAAAAAAAAAAAYWLYGAKDASKHRKMAQTWIVKARGEVLHALEKLRKVDKEAYFSVVENVLKRYAGLGISGAELKRFSSDMKSAWRHVEGSHTKAQGRKTSTRRSTASRRK
jgi:predicted ATP-grasp superfamily ATP-dependent carboligase